MADRLRDATSPYLLQHADNPVDWWSWGDAAFDEARRRDVPVLLSIGYSACHWCHVMAHESFEDQATADLMNKHLVSIKVDREERPDVDAVYMTATQALTGQGGWPMTVFLTHEREPFYCGTYYPREHFKRLVVSVARAWRDERAAVAGQARDIAASLAQSVRRDASAAPGSAGVIDPAVGDVAVATLARRYDARRGGFGGAPKFPPSSVLEFLLRRSERAVLAREDTLPSGDSTAQDSVIRGWPGPRWPRTPDGGADLAVRALAMVAGTAEAMARGGIYDQLAGGFARYSVDAGWVVPHFEKMLYDNAQLASVYAHWWRRSGDDLARRVARETCEWMIAELGTAEGGFASALDADSDGTEGAYYVWSPAEIAGVLGTDDGDYAIEQFAVPAAGNFEDGRSVLRLPADPADRHRFERVRSALLAARAERRRPARDDKVVAAWNGLAIAALADAGLVLDRADFVAAARAAADLLARVHLSDGRLARTSRDGVAGPSAGVLDDYACVAAGFLALSGATGEARWVALAGELLDVAMTRFRADDGGFYDTADDGERLIYRPADPTDGPTPSGIFAVAGALLSYAALTGSSRHRDAAAAALGSLDGIVASYPQAAGWGLAVAEAFLAGPAEIAIVGPLGDERTKALHAAAAFGATPGAVIAIGDGTVQAREDTLPAGDSTARDSVIRGWPGPRWPRTPDGPEPPVVGIPLLAGRGLVNGQPAAYVCRDFTCQLPVTTPEELLAALRS